MSESSYAMNINYSLKINDYTGNPVVGTYPIIVQKEIRLKSDVFDNTILTEKSLTINGISSQSFLHDVIPSTDKIIYDGNRPFDVSLFLTGLNGATDVGPYTFNGVTHSSGSFTGGGITNSHIFNELIEGASYEQKIDITNILQQTSSVSSNVTLNESVPIISNINKSFDISAEGVLSIIADADFLDATSDFNAYIGVFVDALPTDLDAFYSNGGGLKLTPIAPHSAGTTLDIPPQSLTHFYKAPYTSTTQVSSVDSTYIINFFCKDTSTNQLITQNNSTIEIDYGVLVHSASLVNLTNAGTGLAKVGDSIQLSWKTLFKVPVAALNVVLMGQTVTPSTLNNTDWTTNATVLSTQIHNSEITFEITHVQSGGKFETSENTITIDKEAPVFTFQIDTDSISGISVAFYNLQFNTVENYTTQTGYKITFDLFYNDIVEISKTFDLDSNTDATTQFMVDGLDTGKEYKVSARVTDRALNVSLDVKPVIDTFLTADTFVPVFINTETDRVVVKSTIDTVLVENIKVYDTLNDMTLYVALFDSVFDTNVDSNVDYVNIIQSNLDTFSNVSFQSVQSVHITDRTSEAAFINPHSFTFNHYIEQGLSTTDIETEKSYSLFYYAIDHETVTGYDSNISYGEWKNVTVGVPQVTSVSASTDLITNLNYANIVTSVNGDSYIRNDISIATINNATVSDVDIITNNSSYIIYDDEFYVSPLKNEPIFTIALSFTPTSFPSESTYMTLIYQSNNHYIKVNSDGKLLVQWGTDNLSPLIVHSILELNKRNEILFILDSVQQIITVSVNESVVSTSPNYTINISTNSLMYGNNSSHTEGLQGTIHTPLEWVNRALTEIEQTRYLSSKEKAFEYRFNKIGTISDSNIFVNNINVELPLYLVGNDISLNTYYPRIGASALSIDQKTSYLENTDISSVSVHGNKSTVMFWYYHPYSSVVQNNIITLSGSTSEKIELGISQNSGVISMSAKMTNVSNIQHTYKSVSLELTNNTWHHLTYVLKDNIVCFYHDGVFKGLSNEDHTHTVFNAIFTNLKVSGETNTRIDHLNIYKKTLSRNIIKSCYTEVFDSQMLLRYNFELFTDNTSPIPDKIFDESVHNNHGKFYNNDINVSIQENIPITKNAIELDGISEYIEIESNSNLDGSKRKQTTVSSWVNIDDLNDMIGFQPIICKNNVMRFGIDNGIPSMQFGDGTRFFSTSSSAMQLNEPVFSYTERDHPSTYVTPLVNLLFDDNVLDTSGGGSTLYNGTLSTSNLISYKPGLVPILGDTNKAIVFNGNNDFVDLGRNISSNIDDEITISAWIKVDTDQISGKKAILSRSGAFTFGLNNGESYISL